jgi:hypothetical protein
LPLALSFSGCRARVPDFRARLGRNPVTLP